MKKINYLWTVLLVAISLFSCEDEWDSHYSPKQLEVVKGSAVEIVSENSSDYLASATEYKENYQIFKDHGLLNQLTERNQSYTLLVCDNDAIASTAITDMDYFIQSSISDVSLSPTDMVDGATIKMWCGKYLKISTGDSKVVSKADGTTEININIYISGVKVLRIIKTNDAFIYVMEKPVLAPKSLYEVFNELDDTKYSKFKTLVRSYEIKEFDKGQSDPTGVDGTGNTLYDSVFITKNTYLDRYPKSSTKMNWNMRSEAYNSTMLIPDDEVFNACMNEACENVRNSLGREPNAADTLKFNEWIARACFYDKELEPEQLKYTPAVTSDVTTPVVEDINAIAGYQENSTLNIAAAVWRPSVQIVDTENPITLSNGKAYHIKYMHIPNNIVIWRIKHRLYNTYNACSAEEKEEYFRWKNVNEKKVGVRSNGNGGFGGWLWNEATQSYTWPYYLYDLVYGCPSGEAYDKKLPVELEFTGIALMNDGKVAKVMVPPGEYDLCMGWFSESKIKWTMDIYFNGEQVGKGVQPKKSHYDRNGSGYSEYYDAEAMKTIDKNAGKYDLDGYKVKTVTIGGSGLQEVIIRLVSNNLTTVTTPPGYNDDGTAKGGTDGKRGALVCYHWCLRPTSNNY